MLSGFVVAYAYDDRWPRMSTWGFFKRRLIRLQPMIVLGSIVGAALFWFQSSPIYPKLAGATPGQVLLVMLIGFTLVPLPKSMDVRGWDETFPLNGPAWSLFYEYVANILYAAGLRRLPLRWLGGFVVLAAALLVHLAVFGERGDLIGGWSLDAAGLHVGFARVLFPFFAGVLLMRTGFRVRSRHAFVLCSLLLAVALALPRFGGHAHPWLNGLYEAACVILLFPLIVAIGAGEKREDGAAIRLARMFGGLSYPLYITHYPLIYIYTAWVARGTATPLQGVLVGSAVFAAALALAYACLKLYDEPVRCWLAARLLRRAA